MKTSSRLQFQTKFAISGVIAVVALLASGLARGADKAAQAAPAAAPEEVNVDQIKEKYWARGDQTELGVVQNRAFSKAGKFQLGMSGGLVTSDPFLSIRHVGGAFGYHFNEYLGVELLYWKYLVSPSTALKTFQEFSGGTANTNAPLSFMGGNVLGSILYGKLSVLGMAIIYYDMHAMLGAGLTDTETGSAFTPLGGIGQRFYINRFFSVRTDYRVLYFKETIIEKEIPTKLGQVVGVRNNFNHAVTLGVDFMLGVFK